MLDTTVVFRAFGTSVLAHLATDNTFGLLGYQSIAFVSS